MVVTDVTTAAGSRLPDDLSDAVAKPATQLAAAFSAQAGNGPLGALADAAWTLIEAARPYEETWPLQLADAVQAAETALAAIRRRDRPKPARDETRTPS